jgi:hypothetical protein
MLLIEPGCSRDYKIIYSESESIMRTERAVYDLASFVRLARL